MENKKTTLTKLALSENEVQSRLQELDSAWKVVSGSLQREYRFKNFKEALDFTNDIGKAAEEVNHHPDILLSYGKVKVSWFTHSVKGITELDFSLGDKCDALFNSRAPL